MTYVYCFCFFIIGRIRRGRGRGRGRRGRGGMSGEGGRGRWFRAGRGGHGLFDHAVGRMFYGMQVNTLNVYFRKYTLMCMIFLNCIICLLPREEIFRGIYFLD